MERSKIAVLALAALMGFAPLGSSAAAGYPACQHPYPCGDEWPSGLSGPFALEGVSEVWIPSHDGVLLHGWIGRPDVPEGVRVPIAANSDPYLGSCAPTNAGCIGSPSEPGWWADPPEPTGTPPLFGPESNLRGYHVAPIEMIKRGIAVAYFDVRGTGRSEGCFDFHAGPKEQMDQRVIVDWLASRDWSNGRVAMGGHSYGGMTALEAAVENPPGLKTIFASGVVVDPYLMISTPQGAALTLAAASGAHAASDYNLAARGQGTAFRWGPVDLDPGREAGIVKAGSIARSEQCARGYARQVRALEAPFAGLDRDASFWDERRLTDRLEQVTAAVLFQQGLHDSTVSPWQDELFWGAAAGAPKWQILGQWQHGNPPGIPEEASRSPEGELDPSWTPHVWSEVILDWLDFWLWGKGDLPEHVGAVSYQDPEDSWHESSAWPPAEARSEVLYLGSDLSPTPTDSRTTVSMAPSVEHAITRLPTSIAKGDEGANPLPEAYPELCARTVPPLGFGVMSTPLTTNTLLAGEPMAYLRVRAAHLRGTDDPPEGVVGVHVLSIAPGFTCSSPDWNLASQISVGAADLRFHRGNFYPSDFPIGQEEWLRIDLSSVVARIPEGHRIGVTVAAPPPSRWSGASVTTAYAHLTFLSDGTPASSHVVLPFVEGTLGGSPPALEYRARPFTAGATI